MTRQLTERETFANVLASLVLDRCMSAKASRTSRTGLQATVPVDERPYVRRGLDALIEHGMLGMTGEDIGFTPQGSAFATYVADVRDKSPALEADIKDHPFLTPLLGAIAVDERLSPPRPIEDIQTLPARLEGYRAETRSGLLNLWTIGIGAAAAILGVVTLFK